MNCFQKIKTYKTPMTEMHSTEIQYLKYTLYSKTEITKESPINEGTRPLDAKGQ